MEKCILEEQSTFVNDRSILNIVMIATKIIHTLKRKTQGKISHLALKINISKAYNRVDKGFIRIMLLKMGFAES